jgi:hypothetical protein
MSLVTFIAKMKTGDSMFRERIRSRFKYRTGLDVTSVELVGKELPQQEFDIELKTVIENISSMKWFVLVADRMDESLVIMADMLVIPFFRVLSKFSPFIFSFLSSCVELEIVRYVILETKNIPNR